MRRFWNRREKAESKKEIIFKCENTLSWFSDVKTHIIIRFSHSKLTTADKFRIRLYSFVETSQTWFHSESIPFIHWKIGPKSSSKTNLCTLQNSPFDRLGASGEKFIRYESYDATVKRAFLVFLEIQFCIRFGSRLKFLWIAWNHDVIKYFIICKIKKINLKYHNPTVQNESKPAMKPLAITKTCKLLFISITHWVYINRKKR